jgi:hypothetical protein
MVEGQIAPSRPLGIGEVLDSGLRLFRASLLKCLPFGVVMAVMGQVPAAYDVAQGRSTLEFPNRDPRWWALYAIATLVSIIMWIAVLRRQQLIARGERLESREELRAALTRVPAFLGVHILTALAVVLGLILLLVPGIYLMTALSMGGPLTAIERNGPGEAFVRSMELVRGNWWRLSAIFTVILAIVLVIYAVAGLVGAVIATPLAGTADVAVVTAMTSVVLLVLTAFSMPLYTALLLAAYHDLKVRREGADLARRVAALGGP